MSSNLIQIGGIPPLRQSTQEMMACPKFYVTAVIEGRSLPGGLDAARGTEIHKTMAAYLSHCALKGVSADLEAFDQFSRGAGPQAAEILVGLRDGFEVDHSHLFATELTMALDENFAPTNLATEMEGIVADSDLPTHYQGTLDGIYLFPEEGRIRIDDFKSHMRPFDPSDKPQAKEYALFIFKHFPWVNEVVFRLVFVRYRRVIKEVTFTRERLPELIAALSSARARQKQIHADWAAGEEIKAIGNDSCFYCPLLHSRDCPILQENPNAHGEPSEWVSSALVYRAYSIVNNARMRALVQASGKPIVLKDYNGKAYVYGPEEKESEVYPVFQFDGTGAMVMRRKAIPLLPIIDLLYDYAHDNPGDLNWMKNVTISSTSLKRYLKTNKRSFLDQAIEDTADKVTKVRLRVSKPLDAVDLPSEPDDEELDYEEGEF